MENNNEDIIKVEENPLPYYEDENHPFKKPKKKWKKSTIIISIILAILIFFLYFGPYFVGIPFYIMFKNKNDGILDKQLYYYDNYDKVLTCETQTVENDYYSMKIPSDFIKVESESDHLTIYEKE